MTISRAPQVTSTPMSLSATALSLEADAAFASVSISVEESLDDASVPPNKNRFSSKVFSSYFRKRHFIKISGSEGVLSVRSKSVAGSMIFFSIWLLRHYERLRCFLPHMPKFIAGASIPGAMCLLSQSYQEGWPLLVLAMLVQQSATMVLSAKLDRDLLLPVGIGVFFR